MTEKRFTMDNPNDWGFPITDNVTGKVYNCASNILMKELCVVVNTIVEENEQLKKDVEYWKQVASQYSNELNVFEHCKKYKTECKDIHWSSD